MNCICMLVTRNPTWNLTISLQVVSEPKVYVWCVLLDFMHMGFNFMYDMLLLHSKYVYLLFFKCWKIWINSWKDMYAKVFWMHEWRLSLEQNFGVLFQKGGTAKGVFRLSVCVLFWITHTHFEATKNRSCHFYFWVWKNHQESTNLEIVFMVLFLVFMVLILV